MNYKPEQYLNLEGIGKQRFIGWKKSRPRSPAME
jgi:hypothetical protein